MLTAHLQCFVVHVAQVQMKDLLSDYVGMHNPRLCCVYANSCVLPRVCNMAVVNVLSMLTGSNVSALCRSQSSVALLVRRVMRPLYSSCCRHAIRHRLSATCTATYVLVWHRNYIV